MKTLISLLVIVLPVIFRFIGKKLEQAGNTTSPGTKPVADWDEKRERHMEQKAYMQPMPEAVQSPVSETVQSPVTEAVCEQKPAAVPTSGKNRSKKPRVQKPILQEEVQKKREKIDVKKMIIYSEIMKPKYGQQ